MASQIMLLNSSPMDDVLRRMHVPLAQRAFGAGICPVDGKYNTEWYKQSLAHGNGSTQNFDVHRAGDISHSFYVIAELEEGVRPDAAFISFVVRHNNMVAVTRSLAKTVAAAKSRGVWPAFTNRTSPQSDGLRVAYIPLLLDDWPRTSMSFRSSTIAFLGCRCHLELAWESVFVEKHASDAMANLDFHAFENKPARSRCEDVPGNSIEHSSAEMIECCRDTLWQHVSLDFTLPSTSLFVSVHLECPVDASEHPVSSMCLIINGRYSYPFDAPMLEEINWQRCGLIPPTDSYKLREKRQDFMYLVPFSREAFSMDTPTSWLAMGRFDRIALRIHYARLYGTVEVVVCSQQFNVRRYAIGITGTAFTS